jgi:hypothetical protein
MPPGGKDVVPRALFVPMGSDEQVDKVIEFADADNAYDDHIRQQAYELFRRAPEPAAPG